MNLNFDEDMEMYPVLHIYALSLSIPLLLLSQKMEM